MEYQDVESGLKAALSEILGVTPQYEKGTPFTELQGWDSMNTVKLMVTLQKKFGVKFSVTDMMAVENIGELISLIQSKV